MKRFQLILPWTLVLLLAGWSAYGIWPVTPLEGDEQGVLFGVAGMLQHDALLLQMRYTYELQPGYYQLLVGLVRLTGLSPQALFALTTVVGAAGFALAGARLLQLLLAWPLGWTLFAMLWCQEVTAAACYLNTSALAGCLAICAVLLVWRPERSAWGWAGVILALAGWLRADSLLVAPACLGVAFWREQRWKPALRQTAGIASCSALLFLGLYALSGTSALNSLRTYEERGFLLSGWRRFAETIPQLLSPALALAALAGLGLLFTPRRRLLGWVFVGGVTASLLAHGTDLTTPKYFYYMVPFLLIPALALADQLVRVSRAWNVAPRRAAVAGAVALLLTDSLLGLRTLTPAQRFFRAEPTLASLAKLTWQGKSLALVLGLGELIINADGFRVRTGQAFAPLVWHREKQRVQADLTMIRSWLAAGKPEQTFYWANWLPAQLAKRELLAQGYRPPERHSEDKAAPAREDWRREGQVVYLRYLGYAGTTYQPAGPAPASITGPDTYFIGDCANWPLTELADGRSWHLLSSVPEGLVTLYQRR